MPLKLLHANLLGFGPLLMLCSPSRSSSGSWGWTIRLVQQDLHLLNPCWLFPVTCSFMCTEMCSKRTDSVIFQGLGSVLLFFIPFRSWTLFQGHDSQCYHWLSHAHPVLPLLVTADPAVHLIWLAHPVPISTNYLWRPPKIFSTTCVLPCCPSSRYQGNYSSLWEWGSDPKASSSCLKMASQNF